MKRFVAIVMIVVTLFLLTGCGTSSLTGEWRPCMVKALGEKYYIGEWNEKNIYHFSPNYPLKLCEDGKADPSYWYGDECEYTWEKSGNKIYLTYSNRQEPSYEFKISGKYLTRTVYIQSEGYEVTVYYTKTN